MYYRIKGSFHEGTSPVKSPKSPEQSTHKQAMLSWASLLAGVLRILPCRGRGSTPQRKQWCELLQALLPYTWNCLGMKTEKCKGITNISSLLMKNKWRAVPVSCTGCSMWEVRDQNVRNGFTALRTSQQSFSVWRWVVTTRYSMKMKPRWVLIRWQRPRHLITALSHSLLLFNDCLSFYYHTRFVCFWLSYVFPWL